MRVEPALRSVCVSHCPLPPPPFSSPPAGIHSHVGSGIHDPANWTRVGESLFGLLQATLADGKCATHARYRSPPSLHRHITL